MARPRKGAIFSMRYGIFSDIHSNLEAYESVLGAMKGDGLDAYICGGDIVGYGADPSGCVELTRGLTDNVICGNHDCASVGLLDTQYFNLRAKEAVLWTAKNINDEERHYLTHLKMVHEGPDFSVVHGSLDEPYSFRYILDIESAVTNFDTMRKDLLFIGHTHSPAVFRKEGGEVTYSKTSHVDLKEGTSYIVNVGSVGQPRDGDPRASYAVLDEKAKTVEIKRVVYNIKKAQEKILKAGLPPILAERLGMGQ